MDDSIILRSQQHPYNRVFCTTIFAACLNGIAVGFVGGWPQAAIPQLLSPSYMFTESEASWIASVFFLSSLPGGFTSIGIASRFGKRWLFLIASVPMIVGWSIIAIATTFWEFVIGRIVLGFSGGLLCHHTEMYLSEVSPDSIRSKMSILYCASIHIGFLLSYAIGTYLTISIATSVYITVVLILASMFLLIAPETPFWLVKQSRIDDALENLRKLRGGPNVHDEFDNITEFVKKSVITKKTDGMFQNVIKVLSDKANRKAILLVVVLTTAQQFSGFAAMSTYVQLIFERSITMIPGHYVSLLYGLIELCCTLISSCLVEKVGRRPLVAFSSTICAGCMALMGFYLHSAAGNTGEDGGVALPLVCIIVFALVYGLGLATIATVIAAECLSMDARSLGAALQNTTMCFSVIIITKLWQMISSSYGQEYSFWITAIIGFGHTIVLLIILPETRGRSLTEIQCLLTSPSTSPSSSPHKSMILMQHQPLKNVRIMPDAGESYPRIV